MRLVREEIRPQSRRVCVCPGPEVDPPHSPAWSPPPSSLNDHCYAWTSSSCHLCTCSILSHPYLKFKQCNVLSIYMFIILTTEITQIFWLQLKENWVIPLIKSWKRNKILVNYITNIFETETGLIFLFIS